jgi:hypothetical protein
VLCGIVTVVILADIMRLLYRGPLLHLVSLCRFTYLGDAVVNPACGDSHCRQRSAASTFELNMVGGPRDSDYATFNTQARLARDAWSAATVLPRVSS